jgi:anti-sigma B factor antagonist
VTHPHQVDRRQQVGGETGYDQQDGLGALVGSLKRLRMQEGSLALVTSGGRILQLFRMTGLTQVFALHSSVPDAVTAGPHWQAAIGGDTVSQWCRQNDLA